MERGKEVEVSVLPQCDFCKLPNRKLARYDGRTNRGFWANMCEEHFRLYGIGLGIGKGQRLILGGGQRNAPTKRS